MGTVQYMAAPRRGQLHEYHNTGVTVSVFLDCPKMYFQNFQKTHFFRNFLQILKFGPENFGQVVILS